MNKFTTPFHAVIGAGPLGTTITEQLTHAGIPVRVVTRSGGSGIDGPLVERVAADVSDPAEASRALSGAAVVYHCGNPPYTKWAEMWPPLQASALAGATATGAVYVAADNLYMYAPTDAALRPDTPMTPTTRKGRIRAAMARDLFASGGKVTAVRGADFYGPRVAESLAGERVVPRLLAGKSPSTVGRVDLPHAYTYIGDMAATMIAAGADERAWGRPWHAPAVTLTQQQMADALADAAGVSRQRVKGIGHRTVSLVGFVVPLMRELAEMHEQTDRPFTSDASQTATVLGVDATPVADACRRTVRWWRDRASTGELAGKH